jgi:hypothetical protein
VLDWLCTGTTTPLGQFIYSDTDDAKSSVMTNNKRREFWITTATDEFIRCRSGDSVRPTSL